MVCIRDDKYHITESEWHSIFQDACEVNLAVLSYSGSQENTWGRLDGEGEQSTRVQWLWNYGCETVGSMDKLLFVDSIEKQNN